MAEPLDLDHERRIRSFIDGGDDHGDWDGRETTEVALDMTMDAMVYWRSRCDVTEADVVRVGITVEKREAWMSQHATRKTVRRAEEWHVQSILVAIISDDVPDDRQPNVTTRIIREMASGLRISPWTVLAEMATAE